MTFPRDEKETIALYEIIQNRIGWRIVESQSNAFPDAILESNDGERMTCEFEHLAKNFHRHGHPVDNSCDLIICWRNDWPEAPLPVMALENCAEEEAQVIEALLSGSVSSSKYQRLKQKIQGLQRELKEVNRRLRWEEEDFEAYLGEDLYEEVMGDIALRELEKQYGLDEGTLTNQGAGWLKVHNKSNIDMPALGALGIVAIALLYIVLGMLNIVPL